MVNTKLYQHLDNFTKDKINEYLKKVNFELVEAPIIPFSKIIDEVTTYFMDSEDASKVSTVEDITSEIISSVIRKVLMFNLNRDQTKNVSITVDKEDETWEMVFTINPDDFVTPNELKSIVFFVKGNDSKTIEFEILNNVTSSLTKHSIIHRFLADNKGNPKGYTIKDSEQMMDYYIFKYSKTVDVPDTFEEYLDVLNTTSPLDELHLQPNTINSVSATFTDNPLNNFFKDLKNDTFNQLEQSVNNVDTVIPVEKVEITKEDMKDLSVADRDFINNLDDSETKFLATILDASGIRLTELARMNLKEIMSNDKQYRELVNSLSTTISVLREIRRGAENLITIQSKYTEFRK